MEDIIRRMSNVPTIKRRQFLAGIAAGTMTLAISSLTHAESVSNSSLSRNSTSGIADLVFKPLP